MNQTTKTHMTLLLVTLCCCQYLAQAQAPNNGDDKASIGNGETGPIDESTSAIEHTEDQKLTSGVYSAQLQAAPPGPAAQSSSAQSPSSASYLSPSNSSPSISGFQSNPAQSVPSNNNGNQMSPGVSLKSQTGGQSGGHNSFTWYPPSPASSAYAQSNPQSSSSSSSSSSSGPYSPTYSGGTREFVLPSTTNIMQQQQQPKQQLQQQAWPSMSPESNGPSQFNSQLMSQLMAPVAGIQQASINPMVQQQPQQQQQQQQPMSSVNNLIKNTEQAVGGTGTGRRSALTGWLRGITGMLSNLFNRRDQHPHSQSQAGANSALQWPMSQGGNWIGPQRPSQQSQQQPKPSDPMMGSASNGFGSLMNSPYGSQSYQPQSQTQPQLQQSQQQQQSQQSQPQQWLKNSPMASQFSSSMNGQYLAPSSSSIQQQQQAIPQQQQQPQLMSSYYPQGAKNEASMSAMPSYNNPAVSGQFSAPIPSGGNQVYGWSAPSPGWSGGSSALSANGQSPSSSSSSLTNGGQRDFNSYSSSASTANVYPSSAYSSQSAPHQQQQVQQSTFQQMSKVVESIPNIDRMSVGPSISYNQNQAASVSQSPVSTSSSSVSSSSSGSSVPSLASPSASEQSNGHESNAQAVSNGSPPSVSS